MTTRVFLVRHGATVLTAEDRFAGETEVALSEEGLSQARKLGERLAGEPLRAAYASPMGRCMETARLVAAEHRLHVQVRAELREISHGRWEQQTRREVEERYPEEYAKWEQDPYTFAPEGGETGLCVTARALPALLAIVDAHPGEHVLVVSHKATIRLLISAVLGIEPRSYRDRLDQGPAALNILDFKGPTRGRLTLFNDTSHYARAASEIPALPSGRLSKWWDPPGGGSNQGTGGETSG
ncbi:histidine phosphatase family protein [Chondromyces apiculatus]|uniref:Alpha-ribazole-5'-phosphate phosphatase n=1 Tax=Chondromyces apiculatus DSM 436 TaxID=1192034 RepID=A0A017TE56_9BACT|nr:histidine phosphatase family protein [Chondromyces apiculatus]EYF07524.1 Alpha-ribazole-5'-phosphate phosphatase [Chondromyces apiculatus DSM 436]